MSQRSKISLIVFQSLVFSLLFALFGRLFYLQVLESGRYKEAAISIQSRDIVTPAIRGAISDINGSPLVVDLPGLVVFIDRSTLDKQSDKGATVLRRTAALFNLEYADIYQRTRLCGELPVNNRAGCWNGTRYQPIPLVGGASQDVALKIMENSDQFAGVNVASIPIRSYPSLEGENVSHVLGYVGSVTDEDLKNSSKNYYRSEVVGKTGLETQYNEYLRGTPGVRTFLVNRKEVVTKESKNIQAIAGNNLVTNIDAKLQSGVERALEAAVKRARASGYRGDSGAAVVLEIKTGRVLAMASYPTYEPEIWQKGLTVKQAEDLFSEVKGVPALSRPLQGLFAPASTFKSVSVVAAANAGYPLDGSYNCPASVEIGNRTFNNFDSVAAGRLKLDVGLAISCDSLWYQIAYDEWVRDGGLKPKSKTNDYFFNAAKAFGVGKVTGIDLPSELSGRLPNRTWKQNWFEQNKDFYCNYQQRAKKQDLTRYLIEIARENCLDGNKVRAGDAVNFSIGQGDTLVTPIRLAQMYAAIANNGTYYKPQVARAVVDTDGKVIKEFKPEVADVIKEEQSTWDFLHRALRMVVTRGTAGSVFSGFPVAVSGKTGTAQVFGKNPNGSAKDDTSWFASYGPTEDPTYAVVMMVSQGGFGASTSGVGVRDIYSTLFGVTGNKVDPSKAVFPNGVPTNIAKVDLKIAASKVDLTGVKVGGVKLK
ncbi:penicillin-binding protein 2 [Candidatus Nanopelagicus abundans]|uniref:Penicillin-binding protein 2 n=1 Tax=Candidatus Nanopelagicus abundans TaxID=1884916 RepID=A0A249L5A9_9ACTN|nr:penicillin-binding protein 2 [Candidatus Nanopelagicus abundans]ASY24119.1 penicillin-binding protein 2 [Candidatus Nanopelagicus abundans]